MQPASMYCYKCSILGYVQSAHMTTFLRRGIVLFKPKLNLFVWRDRPGD